MGGGINGRKEGSKEEGKKGDKHCLHYNFLLSRITMLLYISVYHEFIKRTIAFR